MNAALAVIAAFLAFALFVGIRARRGRTMSLEQWAVGGRGFGTLLVFLLMAGEAFSTFTFLPSTHLFDNIADLSAYRDGLYWRLPEKTRAEFKAFFAREDAFALGVCNGCQMMSNLKGIIPGADLWPRFVQNQSERYEGRSVSVQLEKSPSLFFQGMEGSVIPIAVAHGEGYAEFRDAHAASVFSESGLVSGRFVDGHHHITEHYPLNPNGSPFGMTALTTTTGRVTIMMPHPERVHRSACMSWAPKEWGEDSPWMQMFYNARRWVG